MVNSDPPTDGPRREPDPGVADERARRVQAALRVTPFLPAIPHPLVPADGHWAPRPFAWQHGRQLLMLDRALDGTWLVAELWFDAESCRYVERRRAAYDWPREALGAMLSRALVAGETAATDSADHLDEWLATQVDA
jgi:hypothetical protein